MEKEISEKTEQDVVFELAIRVAESERRLDPGVLANYYWAVGAEIERRMKVATTKVLESTVPSDVT
tara:strand:- start:582 stop:779 length:198 start_codon:yes stop_codon:yes gene_type:complete